MLDITPNYYSMIERGTRTLRKGLALLFCSRFGVDYDWLQTGQGSPNVSTAERVIRMQRETEGYAQAVRESGQAYAPGWRGRLNEILDAESATIERSRRQLGVTYEAILGGVGRRLDRELEGGES